MKKLISLILVLVMVMSLNPVAYSAKPTANKSVEEILNAYHSKISSISNDVTNRSTYSLNAVRDKNQIKQETMEELAIAGYEAYDVNPETYESVSDALQTDLSALGIDSEGSYIVVVSGEPTDNSGVAPAAVTPPPSSDGDPNAFSYTYGGEVYRLRYTMVTAAEGYGYSVAEYIDLHDNGEADYSTLDSILNSAVSIVVDKLLPSTELGTLISLLGIRFTPFEGTTTSSLIYFANTHWTKIYTQVWHDELERWENGSCVEYANLQSFVDGSFFDPNKNEFVRVEDYVTTICTTVYSRYCNTFSWRKNQGVRGFLAGYCFSDQTGPVEYYFDEKNEDGEVINERLVTTHTLYGVP